MKGLALATLAALIACTLGVLSLPKLTVHREYHQNVQLKTYKFSNCLPADKEILVINSLVLKPDPLHFPGPLSVSFDMTVKDEVNYPLKTVVNMTRRTGTSWSQIPCNGIFGSCTYDDLCSYLSVIPKCPPPLVAAGVPCHCPFKTGKYELPLTTFNVDAAVFPPGDYHIQAHLSMNKTIVGCYDVHFSFE